MIELNKIYNENCIKGMKKINDNFVDLTVTSPPYDNLRKYKDGVGDNWDFNTFTKIADELFRITKEGGIVSWVVGDATIKGGETGTSFKQALYFIELGFSLVDTFIYEKNGSAFPARKDGNRYSQIFEYMFVFSKGTPNTYNLENKNNLPNNNKIIINNEFPEKNLMKDLIKTWSNGENYFLSNSIDYISKYDLKDYKYDYIHKDFITNIDFDLDSLKTEISNIISCIEIGGVVSYKINDNNIKNKLSGVPFRIAVEFINNGFILHDTMLIVEDNNYSFLFIFSYKKKPLNHNLICDKKNRWAGHTSFGQAKQRNSDGTLTNRTIKPVGEFSARNNIWQYKDSSPYNIWKYNNGRNYSTKDKVAFEHPAIFPELLSEDNILVFTNKNDIVLDPFMGSGTTAKMAKINQRNYIGFELSKEYIEISNKRLEKS